MSDHSRCVSLVTSDWFGEDEYYRLPGGLWPVSDGGSWLAHECHKPTQTGR
jgi:hypothetical protein